VVAIVGTPARKRNGYGLIVGLVTPRVAQVKVELGDAIVVSADTSAAPAALDADPRTFVIKTHSRSNGSVGAAGLRCASTRCSVRTARSSNDFDTRALLAATEAPPGVIGERWRRRLSLPSASGLTGASANSREA
jgi:hypothetical protein